MGRAPASFLRKNMDKKLLPRAYNVVSQLQKMKVPVQMNIGFYVLFSHAIRLQERKALVHGNTSLNWELWTLEGAGDILTR